MASEPSTEPPTATPDAAPAAAATEPATTPPAATGAGAVPPATGTGAPAPATSASLYVGDLAQEVTEAMLFEKFNAVGPVASIRVCRDAITRRSLGYAYVNFVNPNDAETAVNDMNYDPVAGRPCRIMWSQRDPAIRRSGVGNIFIKNLDKTIGQKEMYDTFIAFGTILSCKVVVDPEGGSRGFGFIHYETQEAADSAIEKVNGKRLRDSTVYVGPFRSKSERLEEISKLETEYTNLYIKNLPEDIDEDGINKMFAEFGTITSCKIATQKNDDSSEKSRGFGWVSFSNPEEARAAVEAMNDKDLAGDGKKLFVGRAQKKAERLAQLRSQYEKKRSENQNRYKGVNLYVKNLDDTITDDALRKAFEEFGTITSAKVMRDEKEGSKGFGFVCFNSADEATKAVTEMNGKILDKKPLYVALAQRKEERRQQIAMQHNQRLQSMRMQQGMYPNAGIVQPPGAGMMYMPAQMQVPARYPYPAAGMPRPAQFMRAQQQQQMQMQAQGQYRMQPGQPGMPGQPQGGARMPGGRGNQPRQQGKGGRNNAQFRQQAGGARNMPMQQGMPQQAMPPQAALIQQGQEPLTASALASASNAEQKQMLGERLFPLIQSTHADQAGKITGMLLEMDNSELLHLLEDTNALSAKVNEAVKVLSDHAQELARKGAP